MRRRIKVKGVNYLHFVGPCENISQTETFALFFAVILPKLREFCMLLRLHLDVCFHFAGARMKRVIIIK